MKQVALHGKYGEGKFVLVDDDDFEEVIKYRWYYNDGYARTSIYNKGKFIRILMHRMIMKLDNSKLVVDYINHDTLDNRKENLRICEVVHNCRNMNVKRNKLGYKGVHRDKLKKKDGSIRYKYRAHISFNGKVIWSSYRDNIEEAALDYNELAKKYFGEFAYLNDVIKDGG